MVFDWAQIGIKEIINLFLYGQTTTPTDLISDALIRPANASSSIEIDMVSFMASGPGQFAHGAQSSLVNAFMSGDAFAGLMGRL